MSSASSHKDSLERTPSGIPEDEPLEPADAAAVEAHLKLCRRHLAKFKPSKKSTMVTVHEAGCSKGEAVSEKDKVEEEITDDWFTPVDAGEDAVIKLSVGKRIWDRRDKVTRFGSRIVNRHSRHTPSTLPELSLQSSALDLDRLSSKLSMTTGTVQYSQHLSDSPTGSFETDHSYPFDSPNLTPSSSRLPSQPHSAPLSPTTSRLGTASLGLPTVDEHHKMAHSTRPSSARSVSPSRPVPPSLDRRDSHNSILTVDDLAPGLGSRRKSILHRRGFSTSKKLQAHMPRGLQDLVASKLRKRQVKLELKPAQVAAADEVEQALLAEGQFVEEKERHELLYLVEHQRGLVLFGVPTFTSALLYPPDPPNWCIWKDGKITSVEHAPPHTLCLSC